MARLSFLLALLSASLALAANPVWSGFLEKCQGCVDAAVSVCQMEPDQERIDVCMCTNMQPNAELKALPFGCGFVCAAEDTTGNAAKGLYSQLQSYCCANGQAQKNGVGCNGVEKPSSSAGSASSTSSPGGAAPSPSGGASGGSGSGTTGPNAGGAATTPAPGPATSTTPPPTTSTRPSSATRTHQLGLIPLLLIALGMW